MEWDPTWMSPLTGASVTEVPEPSDGHIGVTPESRATQWPLSLRGRSPHRWPSRQEQVPGDNERPARRARSFSRGRPRSKRLHSKAACRGARDPCRPGPIPLSWATRARTPASMARTTRGIFSRITVFAAFHSRPSFPKRRSGQKSRSSRTKGTVTSIGFAMRPSA